MAIEPEQDEGGLDIDAVSDDIVAKLGGVKDDTSTEAGEVQSPNDGQLDHPAGESAAPTDDKAPVSTEPPAAQPPAEPVKGFDLARPPDTWGKEAQAAWGALPAQVQQAIGKREGDIARFVSESQPSLNVAKGFERLVAPYAELYNKMGVNPWQHIQTLLHAHTQLVFGRPEVKAQMFRQLAHDAGIDLGKLSGDNPNVDNQHLQHIRALQERIAHLEQNVTGVAGRLEGAQLSELEGLVGKFAGDKDRAPFFEEVAADIPRFIQSGAAKNLQDAYDMAVLANPVTRQKLIESDRNKAATTAEQAAGARAAKARKAMGANVKASASGRAATSMVGLDEFLKNQLNEIHSR